MLYTSSRSTICHSSIGPKRSATLILNAIFIFGGIFGSVRPQIDAETGVPLHGGKAAALVT